MALKKDQTTTLTGIIIPADWSDDQEVIAVALATADEKEYRIGGNRKGKELLGYLQRQVEVTGALNPDGKGGMDITVKRYIVK
jgi:hypothetical protein